jgi:GPCR-Autoproteolysis INducing (GAIN) domain
MYSNLREYIGHVCVLKQAVLSTSSYLLDDERSSSWMDLPQATQAETATRLLSTVESSAHQLAKKCEQPTVIVNVTVNIGRPNFQLVIIAGLLYVKSLLLSGEFVRRLAAS